MPPKTWEERFDEQLYPTIKKFIQQEIDSFVELQEDEVEGIRHETKRDVLRWISQCGDAWIRENPDLFYRQLKNYLYEIKKD